MNVLMPTSMLLCAMGPLVYISQSVQICSGLTLPRVMRNSDMIEANTYIQARLKFIIACGCFGSVSYTGWSISSYISQRRQNERLTQVLQTPNRIHEGAAEDNFH